NVSPRWNCWTRTSRSPARATASPARISRRQSPTTPAAGRRRRTCSASTSSARSSAAETPATMLTLSTLDIVALAFFVVAWAAYAMMVEATRHGRKSLNAYMDGYRALWMRRMLEREMRMVDMQIMAALQNGTAFFASTSLLAIGGALTLLRSTEDVLSVVATLPLGIQTSRALWEIKVIGLAIILVYAFFKFAWSYRLYNYVAIMLGAMPFASDKESPEAQTHVARTAQLFGTAGRHFN